jgi:ribosomal protein L11 methyltransferase
VIALVLSVPASEAELASDALWALGVAAVEERAAQTEDHLVELWTSLGDDAEAVSRAAEGFPARWRWRLVEIDASVADTWRRHAVPSWISTDLVVTPAWVDVDVPAETTVIRIEPGAAFGLGDHPTTVLCLRALRDSMFPGASVLDVGCGSGVLSVAAAVFGASAVDAIDIAPAAMEATTANAARNGVAALVHPSLASLVDVHGEYDIVLANILAPTLIELAPELRRVLGPSGVLIVSGVLADRHEHVDAALEPLRGIDREVRDGWAVLTYRR